MNTDDFEQRLARTPLRPPPDSWRAEIPGEVRSLCGTGDSAARHPAMRWWRRLRARIASAWAPWVTLGPAWAVILLLNGMATWFGSDPLKEEQRGPAGTMSVHAARAYQSQLALALEWVEGESAEPPRNGEVDRRRTRPDRPGARVIRRDVSPTPA